MVGMSNMARRDVQSLLHPYTNLKRHEETGPMIITHGRGIYLYDDAGREYIDGFAGLWCAALGHGNEELIEAARTQMERVAFTHLFAHKSNEPAIELAEKLKELAPCPASKVLFCSSGSEANDMQIKLSWYAANARGEPERKKIISRRGAYHGVTVAAGSLTGLSFVQGGFDLPVNERFLYARTPYYYREAEPGETEEEFTARLAAELEEMILREGPETIAMFIAEPVMGAGGVYTPPEGYFPAVSRVLEKYGIRFVSDEVICGFGRTGEWFGCQTYGARPTSISMAKALTSAYVPLGAITVEEDIYEALKEESARRGMFGHGFTYTGHPVACAVALKAIEIYERENLPQQVKQKAKAFEQRFRALAEHPLVGDVRAKGLVGAVELVADKATKRPFSPEVGIGARVAALAEQEGLIPRAVAGHNIALCPPLIITEEEIDEMFDRLERALDAAEELARREGWREA